MAIILRRAMEGGAKPLSDRLWIWRACGGCTAPVQIHYTSPSAGVLRQYARCRICENCMKARRNQWRIRAAIEYASSPRTWLLTLTLNVEAQLQITYEADLRHIEKTGSSLLSLTAQQQYPFLAGEGFRLVTKYFKRVRKNTSKSFRYLVVAEPHKSQVPHYHALIHEGPEAVLKRELQENWQHGFSNCKLCLNPKGIDYAAKYITKANGGRVRASVAYGKTPVPAYANSPVNQRGVSLALIKENQ